MRVEAFFGTDQAKFPPVLLNRLPFFDNSLLGQFLNGDLGLFELLIGSKEQPEILLSMNSKWLPTFPI